jgi:hypothetical protein
MQGLRPQPKRSLGQTISCSILVLLFLQVAALLKGRTLVGHAITNDLTALLLDHPRKDIRDTAK